MPKLIDSTYRVRGLEKLLDGSWIFAVHCPSSDDAPQRVIVFVVDAGTYNVYIANGKGMEYFSYIPNLRHCCSRTTAWRTARHIASAWFHRNN